MRFASWLRVPPASIENQNFIVAVAFLAKGIVNTVIEFAMKIITLVKNLVGRSVFSLLDVLSIIMFIS